MAGETFQFVMWALALGAVSAVSLPLGSAVGLQTRFPPRYTAMFAAFGAGALIAALAVELVAPTAFALSAPGPSATLRHAHANFYAMLGGGVLGGILFVMLDAAVNQGGGYVRKTSSTLAHLAKRRREDVRKVMAPVLAMEPFDALPDTMGPMLAGMLRPVDLKAGEVLLGAGKPTSLAHLVLEGEVLVEISGKPSTTFGPGTLVGVLALLTPDLDGIATMRAVIDTRSLALTRQDFDHLRSLSPEFDRACRNIAAERVGQLERHLTLRLGDAVEWTRLAASALRLGAEIPELAVRRDQAEHKGSPLAVWLGILLDGVPESVVIGAGLFAFITAHPDTANLRFVDAVPYTLIAGLFLSNFPEALSSSANMVSAGWGRRRVFSMWLALMVTTALGAGLGFLLASVLEETWLVFAEGLAAGAMLTMISAAMIPEAAAHGKPNEVGLSTLAGFLSAVTFKLLE